MAIIVADLEEWNERILELVERYGLNCYPQEFEMCDHNEMIGYMAYSGIPSRYSHWSFGKGFERTKTMYDYGVQGLPYEMVINTDPCLAYLMRDNSLLLQVLTIAHVYGHNDFFANNFTFTSGTDASNALLMFKTHGNRIDRYIEDPSIGLEQVETVLDSAHSLSYCCQKNLAIKKLSLDEQRKHAWDKAQPEKDPYWEIHPTPDFTPPDLTKIPLEPEEDLLSFIAQYNPFMPAWQRDLLGIVEKETKYFVPQIETKIMNEGWASYWHHKIMNELNLPQEMHMEFLVAHIQVLRPHPGGLNPYHLGFVMWHDIERRWNEGDTGREYSDDSPGVDVSTLDGNDTPGRKRIFQIRESDRDVSFLRRYLTVDLMRELELFQHEKRGNERVITKVADDDHWLEVKETLLKNTGTAGMPVLKVEDANFGTNNTLYLKHYHDGRDLLLEYAEHSLRHVQKLWQNEVVLETNLNGKPSLLKIVDDTLKVEKLEKKKRKKKREIDMS